MSLPCGVEVSNLITSTVSFVIICRQHMVTSAIHNTDIFLRCWSYVVAMYHISGYPGVAEAF